MTVRLGADGTGSNVGALHSLGATFICRYLSDFPSKNLTLGEAQTLSNNGIDIVSNWEDDVNDWAGGYSAGVNNATKAWHQHKACGGPDGRPIYFSVDQDVDPGNGTLHEYFRGLGVGMTPGQIGVYGSTAVCEALRAAGLVSWTWRTMSTGWRGGVGPISAFNIEQTGYFNNTYDRDASITDDFGQWRVGGPSTAPGHPAPHPSAPPPPPVVSLGIAIMCAKEDPSRPQGVTTNSANVTPVQRALVAEGFLHDVDKSWGRGAFGTLTVRAYAAWQWRLGYRGRDADGMPGRASLLALGQRHGFVVVG